MTILYIPTIMLYDVSDTFPLVGNIGGREN
ncbi:hypothetical protein EXIGUO9Y_360324 [Exiguobacterium oxidotolerans]|uniref:Uncharacterized protein n=1 Tax=Exiguobacterium oxidotolerans TaxID=223958 RepID=A0A653IFK6_9BACL|nr:hypothetical protein EXIGUO9Y_360324 [Exiguobacterium oxidotolerans]